MKFEDLYIMIIVIALLLGVSLLVTMGESADVEIKNLRLGAGLVINYRPDLWTLTLNKDGTIVLKKETK